MKMVQMPKLGLPSIFKLKFVELHLYEVEGDYSVNEYVIVPIWNILWLKHEENKSGNLYISVEWLSVQDYFL